MEDQFTNRQIDVSDLPSIQHLSLKSLHKEYLTASMVGSLIFWLIFGGGPMIALFIFKNKLPFVLQIGAPIVLSIVIIVSFLATYYSFKRKKYALRERDIYFQDGLLWRSKTVIPFNRIQHAEVSQGPVERIFGLSSLRIFTAGGSSSDMRISGLELDTASDIKEFILSKTAQDEEE